MFYLQIECRVGENLQNEDRTSAPDEAPGVQARRAVREYGINVRHSPAPNCACQARSSPVRTRPTRNDMPRFCLHEYS